MLRSLELDAPLLEGSHKSWLEWENHLHQPAGHAAFDAAQDAIGKILFVVKKILYAIVLESYLDT